MSKRVIFLNAVTWAMLAITWTIVIRTPKPRPAQVDVWVACPGVTVDAGVR